MRIIDRLDLLSQEMSPPNKELLYFIACFHGLSTKLSNERAFRDRFYRFLLDLKWSETEIDLAFTSLARYTKAPQNVEEAIVHDANYIELLGALPKS